MSNQSGISGSNQLRAFFGSCRDGRVRFIKVMSDHHPPSSSSLYYSYQVSISDAAEPCLELDSEQEASGSWEEDWDRTVPGEIDPDQPCFILYRLDEKDSSGYRWIFLSWSPDHANTRYHQDGSWTRA